jgi:hypothetical protein
MERVLLGFLGLVALACGESSSSPPAADGNAGEAGSGAVAEGGAGLAGVAGKGSAGEKVGAGGANVGDMAGAGGTMGGPSSIDELLTTCPSAAAMDEIDQDLELIFDNVPMANDAPVCFAADGSRDLSRAKERAYQSLLAMKAIVFDAALPWTELGLYDWFIAEIDGIIFEETQNFCCSVGPAGTGRYLHVRLGEGSAVYSTELWVNGVGLGMLNMVDVMVHESRHAESGQHTCDDFVSDRTAEELGAWGTVYNLHRWLAYHSDPCFVRPTLAPQARFDPQVVDEHGYQLASLRVADRTAEVRFCETSPALSDITAEPLPTCNQ